MKEVLKQIKEGFFLPSFERCYRCYFDFLCDEK